VSKKKSEYVNTATYEKGMDFMVKSFAKVFTKFDNQDKLFTKIFERFDRNDKVIESLLKEMQSYGKEAREYRMSMSI
jgi:hypothetical protein